MPAHQQPGISERASRSPAAHACSAADSRCKLAPAAGTAWTSRKNRPALVCGFAAGRRPLLRDGATFDESLQRSSIRRSLAKLECATARRQPGFEDTSLGRSDRKRAARPKPPFRSRVREHVLVGAGPSTLEILRRAEGGDVVPRRAKAGARARLRPAGSGGVEGNQFRPVAEGHRSRCPTSPCRRSRHILRCRPAISDRRRPNCRWVLNVSFSIASAPARRASGPLRHLSTRRSVTHEKRLSLPFGLLSR